MEYMFGFSKEACDHFAREFQGVATSYEELCGGPYMRTHGGGPDRGDQVDIVAHGRKASFLVQQRVFQVRPSDPPSGQIMLVVVLEPAKSEA